MCWLKTVTIHRRCDYSGSTQDWYVTSDSWISSEVHHYIPSLLNDMLLQAKDEVFVELWKPTMSGLHTMISVLTRILAREIYTACQVYYQLW